MTGSGAFLGSAEKVTLQAVEGIVNRSGGIRGRPVRFVVADDQSSPAIAVQLANRLVSEHAAVMIGPSLSATCSAVAPLVNHGGPVQYCVSPGIHPAPDSYTFSTSMSVRDSVAGALRFIRNHGWHRVAVLSSLDATGQEGDEDIRELIVRPENKELSLVADERMNVNDVSVGAQVARIGAQSPDILIAWTTGTGFGLVLKQLSQSAATVPVLTTSGNAITQQMEQYSSILPKELYFSALVGLGIDVLRPGPILEASKRFNAALKAQGLIPDNGYIFAWDPAMILVDALRRLGPDANATQIRDYVEQLHGFAGINGLYDFRDGSQRGLGINAEMVIRWDPATKRWIPASGPGGSKL